MRGFWLTCVPVLYLSGGMKLVAAHDDWPMWRHDAGRTAVSDMSLPESLQLQWVKHLPEISPAFHSTRLQFDAGYEPIAANGRLLFSSSRNDSVTACDAVTGREQWVFRTGGPVRFAPAVWKDSVCFGSDDGCFYCVSLSNGKLRWKYRAVPSDRRLLGNRRLISVWPVRGGPVVADGLVYFAAGVWPFEGVFVYAMDIATGGVVWRNEHLGHMFGQQPHNTQAIGGLAPQGYLVINGSELIVPCSTAYPARLNRETGQLIEFQLPAPGRLPGGWFAAMDMQSARAVRRGQLTFDDVINSQLHEDKVNKGHGVSGISRSIQAGGRSLKFDEQRKGVDGTIHSLIAAAGRLYVSTCSGKIYCFAEADETEPVTVQQWSDSVVPPEVSSEAAATAASLVRQAGGSHGLALVVGVRDGSVVRALVKHSNFHVVAFDSDAERVNRLRCELQQAGLYGVRAAVVECGPNEISVPSYVASLITTEDSARVPGSWPTLLQSLRPYGGTAIPRLKSGSGFATAERIASLKPGNFELSEFDGEAVIRRTGPLPETAEYRGQYALCEDKLVRFPLGVLWFDDTLAHFKRSPQPQFIGGVMVSRPKDWHAPRVKGDYSIDYPLLRAGAVRYVHRTNLRSDGTDGTSEGSAGHWTVESSAKLLSRASPENGTES